MPSFTWPKDSPNGLTISVSEMSRTAALTCARDFNAILAGHIFPDDASLLMELEVLCVIHSPSIIRVAGEPNSLSSGTKAYAINDNEVTIMLPMTAADFAKLPYSLTTAWIEAAVNANDWVINDLKNAYRRIAQKNAASPSGGVPSSEQTETPPMMRTTGT